MTMERAQKLIDLGFDWSTTDPRHVSWEDRYEQLKDFNVSTASDIAWNGAIILQQLSLISTFAFRFTHGPTLQRIRQHMDTLK